MKKCVFALSVVCAACSVSAQSSVTMYGIVDTAVGYGSGSLSSRTQLLSGGNASSRVGFRGKEDLGGGMSASFVLEMQVNADNGTGTASNTNNQTTGAALAGLNGGQGLMFNRRSTVSLAGSWGEVRLGRDYTAHYRNRSRSDPFGNVGVGTFQPQVATIGGLTGTRASNMIGYFTPEGLGGFNAIAQYYMGENASGAVTSDDGKGYSVLVGYSNGPLTINAAQGRTQYARTATAGDTTVRNIGLSYDFGVARLLAAYFRDTVERNVELEAKGYSIGARIPVSTGELKAAWSMYKTDAAGAPEARKIALGYVHNLSKRTAAYVTWAQVKNSGGAAFALNGSTTAANQSSRGYDLGLRHSF